MKTAVIVLGVLAAVTGAVAYSRYGESDEPGARFRTEHVERGDLIASISATGTVEPEDVIDVGAQVAGKISSLGVDPSDSGHTIDYGSVVEKGTTLAHIDDAVYRAHVDQARASVLRAQADLLQTQARSEQAKLELDRAERLRETKAIADSLYDLAVANNKVGVANVGVADATLKQGEAALRLAETNLNYTVIKSPVAGVIIDRRVNVGQTVVASLNAPSLFLIAKDLKRMQVWASVNEADIGRIKSGMPVRFTLETYPGEEFLGEVAQIRFNATMTQNVVTYTVVVSTDNSDGRLLPYLTANLRFEVEKRKDVFMVPNAALRYRPRPDLQSPDAESAASESTSRPSNRPSRGDKPSGGNNAARQERGRLWLVSGAHVRPIEVKIGATDGTHTEVTGPDLKDDLEIAIGEVRPKDADAPPGTTNPFAPRQFRGQRSQQ